MIGGLLQHIYEYAEAYTVLLAWVVTPLWVYCGLHYLVRPKEALHVVRRRKKDGED